MAVEIGSRVLCTECITPGCVGKEGTVLDIIQGIPGRTMDRYEIKIDGREMPVYLLEWYNFTVKGKGG